MEKIQYFIIVLMIVGSVVMSSGCFEEQSLEEMNAKVSALAYGAAEKAAQELNEKSNGTNTDSQASTDQTATQDSTTSQNSQSQTTPSSQSSAQDSSTSVSQSCSHPSITTVYVGLDKTTGKIIYDTYCSKCGEYMGRVLY